MQYIGNVIRPPSEADSIILQVTVGCSYNKCTFCGAYKDTPFTVKSPTTVEEDLLFAAKHCKRQKRLFLADGDVLILPQKKLLNLLGKIREYLPWIRRVSLYGNARAVRNKTKIELKELADNGLDRIYLGLESGSSEVLNSVRKGETPKSMIEAARKAREAGLFLSVTALLGLGGKTSSDLHAKETGKVLRLMHPNQIAVLTLIPLENSPLGKDFGAGRFQLPTPGGMLKELYSLLIELTDVRCQFHANHASSYLPLSGRLPKDRQKLVSTVELAMAGEVAIVPEYRRAL